MVQEISAGPNCSRSRIVRFEHDGFACHNLEGRRRGSIERVDNLVSMDGFGRAVHGSRSGGEGRA